MHKNRVVEHGAKDDVTMRSGSLWKAMPAPRGSLLMCLVVPVRNEALVLASTLASIAAQRTLQGTPFDLALALKFLFWRTIAPTTARPSPRHLRRTTQPSRFLSRKCNCLPRKRTSVTCDAC